ncbi:MAG TPA: thiamine pyrophosphate-binding protein [Bryobacterales bacterium]|nr:thiamine pyrophosphate-binding protein [Bryobacterales bacterium]
MPTGSELFVSTLQHFGVTHLFTLVGDHLNDVLRVADREGLRLIDVRHESAATHMADGWARFTRQPGVSLVTGGPGHTNSITGIATGFATCSPMVTISGMRHSKMGNRNAFQELDQLSLMSGVTKWAAAPPDAAQLPFYLQRAFAEAITGRPGPVHLSVPFDLFSAEVASAPPLPAVPTAPRPAPESSDVDRLLELLSKAERPVVIAGSGVWWSGACAELERFIQRTLLPVYTICLARGAVSDLDPSCFGYADPALNRAAQKAFREADLFLILGKRIDYRLALGGPRLLNPQAKVVQVDIHPSELGLNRRLELGICADIQATLKAALQQLDSSNIPERRPWREHLRDLDSAWREELAKAANDDASPIHPARFFTEISSLVPEDAILCWDGGDFVHWGRALLRARRPMHWLRLGPLATLGACLPIGLVAKIVHPGQPSIVIAGDGSVGFYMAEFDTAVRHNLPVVIVVGNDGCWGIEKQFQLGAFGGDKTIACDLRRTRYDLVMKAFGGEGEHVERADQIRPAFERALASGRPYCLNVEIRSARSPFAQYQLEGKK